MTPPDDPRRWLALVVILVAGFMDLLDATIVNVAIPTLQQDLGADNAQIEWIVSSYVLSFAAVLITGGRLGDIFGRKRLFLIGVAGFSLASLLCGVVDTATLLILARFLQGAMAALMVPQVMAIVQVTFSQDERGKVFGILGAVLGFSAVAGPILGGLLINANLFDLTWRPIFLINVPVGIVAALVARSVVRESTSPTAARLDVVGIILSTTATLLLVYPLTEGQTLDWPTWTFAMMGCSALILAVFVAYERRRSNRIGSPLVVLSLFRISSFTLGIFVLLLFMMVLGAFYLVWNIYMQAGLEWTALHAGLTSLFFAAPAGASAAVSVQSLIPRFGRRTLMAGALLMAIGIGIFGWTSSYFGSAIDTWKMAGPLVVAGIGYGLVIAPIFDYILMEVPVDDAGSASGLLSTAQQLAVALGVALVGVVFFGQLSRDAGTSVDSATTDMRHELTVAGVLSDVQDDAVTRFQACVGEQLSAAHPSETPAGCRSAGGSPRLTDILARAAAKARANDFTDAFRTAMWYSAGMLIIAFFAMFGLRRNIRDNSGEEQRGAPGPSA